MKDALIKNIDLIIELIENDLNFHKMDFNSFYDEKYAKYDMEIRRERILEKIRKKIK